MRRSLNHVLLLISATAIEPACNKKHCEAGGGYLDEWDYNHGDRCPLELSTKGKIEIAPGTVRLAPSIDGVASKGTFTITALSDEVTVADGYVMDIGAKDEPGCVGVTMTHASVETPCFIESDSLLRCLLDSTGTTKIEVSSTRSTPGTCHIDISSGNSDRDKKADGIQPWVVTVEIANPVDSQAIVIHSPLENGTTCDSKTPCPLMGRLAAGVCTPGGASLMRAAEFYVATERDGVLASNSAKVNVTPAVIRLGAGGVDIYDSGDCQKQDVSSMLIDEGKAISKSRYLCADGRAGVYQLLAVADITGKNDSLVVSAPTAPHTITATKTAKDAGMASDGTTGDGTSSGGPDESTSDPSPGAEFTYTVNIIDVDSAGIPDLEVEIVTDDNATHKVITDAFGSATQELSADLSTLRIQIPAWEFACTIEIP